MAVKPKVQIEQTRHIPIEMTMMPKRGEISLSKNIWPLFSTK
jgi:hypothetical protein